MIRVTIQMKVKPGRGGEFERAWQNATVSLTLDDL